MSESTRPEPLRRADIVSALAAPPARQRLYWTERDVLLYHLSLGAGREAASDPEEAYTLESRLRVLPTFALVAGQGISTRLPPPFDAKLAGLRIDPRRLLHAGQDLSVHRLIPSTGEVELTYAITQVLDKGSGALVVLSEVAREASGEELWSSRCQLWIRGAGGFGGEPASADEWAGPDRAPDQEFVLRTTEQQALLYRLNGDMNPLHADRALAAVAGFERPILHGLSSYGMVAKGIVDHLLGGDVERLASLSARFRHPVFPGQRIDVRTWLDGSSVWFEATCPDSVGAVVIDRGTATLR